MNRLQAVVTTVLLFALTACAGPSRWQHANKPPEEWKRDRDTCKAEAAEKIELRFGPEPAFPERADILGDPRPGSEFERIVGQSEETRLFEQCMRRRGYEKVRPHPGP
jgi:hypothetical protein